MAEIEIDMNQRIGEWATLTESGSRLVPVYGKGYTGFDNLGNTCYMNSVMQVNKNNSIHNFINKKIRNYILIYLKIRWSSRCPPSPADTSKAHPQSLPRPTSTTP